MRRGLGLLLAVAALAGCASQTPLVDSVSKGQVEGDANQVRVQGGRIDALPLAVIHCSVPSCDIALTTR